MIRFNRVTLHPLNQWLVLQPVTSSHRRYEFRLWREVNANFGALRDELVAYAQEALDDARARIRAGFDDALSPFAAPDEDPAQYYPAMLNRITLQGYLGETLAGLTVEHFGAFGYNDWHVPAYLFRFHNTEFEHLDLINERLLMGEPHDPDTIKERRPGRTGDDAIAFRIDEAGKITHVLTLEAKCLITNSAETISDAHGKLAAGGLRPSGIRELINLLKDYETADAQIWLERLLDFYRKGFRAADRRDGVAYAVEHSPKTPKTRLSWIPSDAPHADYKLKRHLTAMEFHFEDIAGLVDILYRGT